MAREGRTGKQGKEKTIVAVWPRPMTCDRWHSTGRNAVPTSLSLLPCQSCILFNHLLSMTTTTTTVMMVMIMRMMIMSSRQLRIFFFSVRIVSRSTLYIPDLYILPLKFLHCLLVFCSDIVHACNNTQTHTTLIGNRLLPELDRCYPFTTVATNLFLTTYINQALLQQDVTLDTACRPGYLFWCHKRVLMIDWWVLQ